MENEVLIAEAMLGFIDRFIERQQLVLEVLRDTWPHILIITGQEGERSTFLDALENRDSTPQSGFWGENQEWDYFIHGMGCRLRHVETGEPIEWDSPDLQRFDRFWFTDWLMWAITQSGVDGHSHILQTTLGHDKQSNQDIVLKSIHFLEAQGNLRIAEYPNSNKCIRLLP